MATRTAKGVATLKALGTTVTLADVSVTAGHSIIAVVGTHSADIPTSVFAGNREMNKVVHRADAVSGFMTAIYYIRNLKATSTRDIVATWASDQTARFILVNTLDAPILFHEAAGNISTTASPTTSANLLDLPVHNCFHIGAHVAQGPSTDISLTVPTDWTVGQRGGTAGIPQTSNITVTEAYKTGRCIDAEESDTTGTDSRDYCSILASFKPAHEAIPLDFNGTEIEVGDLVTLAGGVTEYTVTELTYIFGHPMVRVTIGTGLIYESLDLEVVE